MIKYKTLFYILLGTSPFINTSFIPGAKLPMVYLVMLFVIGVIVIARDRVPSRIFGSEDIAFSCFLTVSLLSVYINAWSWPMTHGVTQVINLLLTYLIYKVAQFLLVKSALPKDEMLPTIFKCYSWIQVPALILLVFGNFNREFNIEFIHAINNAGNFDVGAIESVYPNIRLTGFSPEPSFWSFFVAINIAVGLSLKRFSPWLMAVNGVSLLVTVGRTGYLIAACILVIWFIQGKVWRTSLIAGAALIAAFFMREYFTPQKLMSVDDSFRQRIDSMLVAFNLGCNNPFFGIGLGNFQVFAEQQHLDYGNIFNWYLNVFALIGVAGIATWMIFSIFLLRRIQERYWLPVFGAFVGWLTVSAFNLPFVWVVFAALVCASTSKHENETLTHASAAD
ncbi:O-antigen ligase family protein [Pseudochryseolinea flava]|uniref:O-antigen ligase-related domain-containing protein n=1 Tax=Pseudochryseolinea flava TaxID=2059302 RepID=A0A364XZE3_9BACT|nr:O-antigen ligase family protein [Pseudochryseolinea flava]RAV99754.1 hypothetical protein DQQ10_17050 [Pseudochryseolinea flava]